MSAPPSPSLPLLRGPELADFCDYVGCFAPRPNATVEIQPINLLRALTSGMISVVPDIAAKTVPPEALEALFRRLKADNNWLIFIPLGGPLRDRVYQLVSVAHYSSFIAFLEFSPDFIFFVAGNNSFSQLPLFTFDGFLPSLPSAPEIALSATQDSPSPQPRASGSSSPL